MRPKTCCGHCTVNTLFETLRFHGQVSVEQTKKSSPLPVLHFRSKKKRASAIAMDVAPYEALFRFSVSGQANPLLFGLMAKHTTIHTIYCSCRFSENSSAIWGFSRHSISHRIFRYPFYKKPLASSVTVCNANLN